jgi:hypothetical protein
MPFLRLVAAGLLVPVIASGSARAQVTDRIIEEDVRVRLPLLPCTVPGAAIRIAESLPVPFGLELVPEPCGENGKQLPDKQDEVVLTGMSVSRAFDRLVELDERYVWSEVNGVLVVRPGVTWFDSNHFLNRRIPRFRVKDGRMWAAMDAVHSALSGARGPADEMWPATTPQSDRRFSVSLGTTTVVDALNAVARAHGSLRWTVEYCKPQALFEYATVRLNTFDGGGIGRHSATRRDDGTWSDACGSTSK